jgi:hypothetical protein
MTCPYRAAMDPAMRWTTTHAFSVSTSALGIPSFCSSKQSATPKNHDRVPTPASVSSSELLSLIGEISSRQSHMMSPYGVGGISPSYIESSINSEFSNVPIQIVTIFLISIMSFVYSKRSMNSLTFKNTEMQCS